MCSDLNVNSEGTSDLKQDSKDYGENDQYLKGYLLKQSSYRISCDFSEPASDLTFPPLLLYTFPCGPFWFLQSRMGPYFCSVKYSLYLPEQLTAFSFEKKNDSPLLPHERR
jgi:hypothetical protein